MNITPKTSLIIGSAYFLLILTLAVVSRFSVMAGFVNIEAENARVDGIRVLNEINDDMATLAATTGDWAPWDETYQFIQDLNPAYIEGNLTEATLMNIRVNFMVFVDLSGEILFSKFVDLSTGKTAPMPGGLSDNIQAVPELVTHKAAGGGRTGILKTDQGPAMVSSSAILESDASGPAKGSLVMGRYLDDREIQTINKTTRINAQLYLWEDPQLPEDCRAAQPRLSRQDPIYTTPSGEDQISTYLLLTDFSGSPVAMLKASADRKIYQAGLQTWKYYVVSMAAIGLVFTILIMGVLNRIILSPLNRLNRKVQGIGKVRNFYARLPVQTTDEIGQLAVEINKMLKELSSAGKKLSEQSYQSGLSEMASDMLHQIRNSMSPIIGNIDLMESGLDQAGLKRIDQALEELAAGPTSDSRRDDLLQFARMAVTRLKTVLEEIRGHLNEAREPVGGIEKVLQEYQLTAGISPHIRPISLTELVEDALEKIETDEGQNLSGRVMLDPGLSGIGPVLGNRVSLLNVVKILLITVDHLFKPAGDSKNEIHIMADEISGQDPAMVVLSITNTGESLDPEIVDRIFDRGFFNPSEYGAGTSLHWCANVVNAMGGRLRAGNRKKNQGTSFHLTLPGAGPAPGVEENIAYGN